MAGSWGKSVKGAIGGVLFGVVLFFGAFPALFFNEGHYASREADLNQAKKEVQDIDATAVDSSAEGKLVHATAEANTDETLSDSEFGIAENAIHLKRNIEMYQWREKVEEKKTGSDENEKTEKIYKYDTIWSNEAEELTAAKAGKKTNPNFPQFADGGSDGRKTAKDVTLGAFKLPSSLVGQIKKSEPVPPSLENASDAIKKTFVVSGNFYYRQKNPSSPATDPETTPDTGDPSDPADPSGPADDPSDPSGEPSNDSDPPTSGDPTSAGDPTSTGDPTNEAASGDPSGDPEATAEPEVEAADPTAETQPETTPPAVDTSSPEVGDVRVSFEVVRPMEVSIMSRQIGETFEPWTGNSGTSINVLSEGAHSSEAMVSALEAAALFFVWMVRILGTLAMAIGIFSMLYPLQAIANILPFLGRLVGAAIGLFSIIVALGLSVVTISIAWLIYRPLYGILLLVAGLAIIACGVFVINWFRGGSKDDEPQLKNA